MKKRPNIIIFNPDEMRWDTMGHMGNPAAQTPLAIGLFGMYGMVILGLIVNLIAMKFYDLTPEKMAEIRQELDARKDSSAK